MRSPNYTLGRLHAFHKFGQASPFKPVPPPAAPKPQALQVPKAPKPTPTPQGTPRAAVMPVPQLNPANNISQPPAKFAQFNMEMTPRAKAKPGEIDPDNGSRVLGTNFDGHTPREVSKGFDALREQPKNLDPLDVGEISAFEGNVI